jgi:mercuric ion binding protein
MKIKCFILATVLAFFAACSGVSTPPSAKTADFKVWGNCGMCKKTIEGSLKENTGILKAEWDVKSKQMTVSFDTLKTSLSDIQLTIAKAGYDNVAFKGDSTAYAGLHECCQYTRK